MHAIEAMHSLNASWKERHGIVEGVLTGGPVGELISVFADPSWRRREEEEVFRVLHGEVDAASRSVAGNPNCGPLWAC